MRPSLRFLSLIVIAWAGIRAATLGVLPGAEFVGIEKSEAKVPPIVPTQFPAIEPIAPAQEDAAAAPMISAGLPYGQRYPAAAMRPVILPIYYGGMSRVSALPARSAALTEILPTPRPQFYSPSPALDEWPLSRIAAMSFSPLQSSVVAPQISVPVAPMKPRLDRLQMSMWAMLRPQQAGIAGPQSLASGGSLGGSQAGARLIYNFTRQIAATFRSSSDVGRRGGEIAGGVRVQPLHGIPLWITAERRQRVGQYGGGRSAFALFFEGGLWDRPMPLHFLLDTYLQAGVVGARSRDKFVDGGLTLTRPVYKNFSAGFGVWGGAQPGLYRVDAGPRISMRVRNNVRVHFDWRQRLAGNASPGSGPAVTLAGDF
ncbi:MAG: hypothetical protein ACM3IG_04935 [Myxococcales bacterium]|jgi:hypothetical protein|nr:hypothetical protein [Sphingomicrobium sp.]